MQQRRLLGLVEQVLQLTLPARTMPGRRACRAHVRGLDWAFQPKEPAMLSREEVEKLIPTETAAFSSPIPNNLRYGYIRPDARSA